MNDLFVYLNLNIENLMTNLFYIQITRMLWNYCSKMVPMSMLLTSKTRLRYIWPQPQVIIIIRQLILLLITNNKVTPSGKVKIADLLIKHGANINLLNSDKKTSLQIANQHGELCFILLINWWVKLLKTFIYLNFYRLHACCKFAV